MSFSGERATLVARGSGVVLALRNPGKPPKVDRVGELKKQLGGKNRFRIGGGLVDGRAVILESFAATDWKDE